jgi:nucleotide-binding universal stress UspA family protein
MPEHHASSTSSLGSTGNDRPEHPPGPPLEAGRVIDRFQLQEKLHTGGMAFLWKVIEVNHQGDSRLPLIMKVPRIKGGEDPATIVGFEVEQMIMPMLSGPHVPKFIAKGDFTRQPYIVMERIDGPSLRPRLDEAPLPLDEVIEIGSRVATALHDLHRQHLVHLDVKPSNILFRPDGTAVLVDFGLSRHDHLPDLLDEEFTLPMGTGPYMSPEQVQFIRNDPRSDLFALGVMLYHFTTGERPFGAPDTVRGLRRRLYVDPVPPRAIRADCPPWLQEVILRCLEVKPERRYQSAAQLALDLQNPSQVALTRRAEKLQTSGAVKIFKRWFFALGAEPARPAVAITEQLNRNPVVMAAVDVDAAAPELLEQLRETVRRIVLTEHGARLACVSVMRVARIGMDDLLDEQGRSRHVKQLVALKHWARPIRKALDLDEGRLTFHVLEASDAAAAIIDFAQRNQVDHIVMGARGTSSLRRFLGSVSSQVVAQSDCSVTVVRAPVPVAGEAPTAASDAAPEPPAGAAPAPNDAAATASSAGR